MPLRPTLASVPLLFCFIASTAAAKSPPAFNDHPLAVELRTGLATSVGLIGVVAELTPLDFLTVGGGVGNNGYGSILGAHVRLRPIVLVSERSMTLAALTLETAYSHGRYAGFDFDPTFGALCEGSPDDPHSSCYRTTLVPEVIHWAQVEVGAEVRLPSRLTLRSSVGGATALGWPAWHCESLGAAVPCVRNGGSEPGRSLLVLTFALGYAF